MDRSSRTAQFSALARASLTRDEPPFDFVDTMAHRLLTPLFSVMLSLRALTRPLMQRQMPGTYTFFLARGRFFEAALQEALAEGATQVVLLGAGFDTRAYRIAYAPGVRVFEVDAPPTSALKQDRVRSALGALPAHVTYVPVDFLTDSIDRALPAAGYEPSRRTFFLWEGVTFYLSEAAVTGVLDFVRTRSAPGSTIAFDHLYDDVPSGTSPRFGAREGAAFVRKQGEPFTWGLPEGGEREFLLRHGLECDRCLNPADMERMLEGTHGTPLKERVAGIYGLLRARVPLRSAE